MKKKNDELQQIPYVGPSIAQDLRNIGMTSIAKLKGQDPELLYKKLCTLYGEQDRCMLYTLRMVVYYATEPHPKPGLLKWWKWKKKD